MTDWTAEVEPLEEDVHRYVPRADGEPMTYRAVVAAWCENGSFRRWWNETIAGCPFRGVRWETPAVTRDTFDRPFECVLIRADNLRRRVDRESFAAHFAAASGPVTLFPSLRGDSQLVVPCPRAEDETIYVHLAAFVRGGSTEQCDEFWQVVGTTLRDRLGDDPIWLNTAGMGVAWLHVRLDSRPKYYRFEPYRTPPARESS